jgi:hypothetical protein
VTLAVASGGRSSIRVDVLIAGLCVIAFGWGMPAQLLKLDDSLYLYQNTEVLGRPGWSGLLGMWDSTRAWRGQYVEFFPLRDSVYWAVYQVWQLTSWPYHVASLSFHIGASLVLVRLGVALGLSARVAAVAAVLFAVHPVHIESVEWASGLKDPMYCLFMFGSLLAYARYRVEGGAARYALALGLCVLSLLVKSMAISLPLLLVAMERLIGSPTSWKQVVQRVFGFAAVCALFLAQFVLIGRANHAVTPPHGGSWLSHLVLTSWAQVKYLKQVFVPSSFRLIYCFEPTTGLRDGRLWVAVVLAVVVVGLLWRLRSNRLLLFAAAWYGACLLPVSNLVPFPAIVADRYLYAAAWGACLLVASLVDQLGDLPRKTAVAAMVAALTLTCAMRSSLWNDEEALWAESDEDPECLLDLTSGASDSHLLRAWAAKDPEVALLAIERAIVSPGLQVSTNFCNVLDMGAHHAMALGHPERGEPWARIMAQRCPWRADSWMAVMVTTQQSKPHIALAAASKAYRLSHSPAAAVMVGLLKLKLGLDGLADADDAVSANPAVACPLLIQWTRDEPAQAPRVAELVERCLRLEALQP